MIHIVRRCIVFTLQLRVTWQSYVNWNFSVNPLISFPSAYYPSVYQTGWRREKERCRQSSTVCIHSGISIINFTLYDYLYQPHILQSSFGYWCFIQNDLSFHFNSFERIQFHLHWFQFSWTASVPFTTMNLTNHYYQLVITKSINQF